jgi:YD repeat-containing protein
MGTVRFLSSGDGGRVERILPNGVHSVFEYASDRRLSSLRHIDSSGREIASFIYNYGPTGRVQDLSVDEQGHTSRTGYVWDTRGRMQEMNISGGAKFHYKYDEKARRLALTSRGKTVTFYYDALGRVSKAQGIAFGVPPQGTLRARREEGAAQPVGSAAQPSLLSHRPLISRPPVSDKEASPAGRGLFLSHSWGSTPHTARLTQVPRSFPRTHLLCIPVLP